MSEEALRESLRAFVGPGCSSFDGRPCRLERSDEVERDIGRLTGDRRVFAFEGDAARVGAALLLMIGVWSQVPRGRGVSFVRPLGRVRRSFEQALALGDARQAKACIEEMAGDGLLDAVNLNFLRVQYLSATQQWPALLELARDEALIDVRPPTPVLEDVARAVFLTSIGFDRAPNEALDLFNREVGDEFRGLFVAGDEIRHPDALALFALYWTSIGDRASVERLLGIPRYKGLPLHQLATSLLDLVSRSDEPTLSLGEAEGARDRGEFEQAFLIASQLPENDDRRAEILVHSAYELRRKSEARIALSSVDALPGGAPEFSSTRSRGNWLADLRRITQQPQGWLDWAAAAVREGGESVALRDALESNARSWGLQQTTAEEMSTLAAQLNEVEVSRHN